MCESLNGHRPCDKKNFPSLKNHSINFIRFGISDENYLSKLIWISLRQIWKFEKKRAVLFPGIQTFHSLCFNFLMFILNLNFMFNTFLNFFLFDVSGPGPVFRPGPQNIRPEHGIPGPGRIPDWTSNSARVPGSKLKGVAEPCVEPTMGSAHTGPSFHHFI